MLKRAGGRLLSMVQQGGAAGGGGSAPAPPQAPIKDVSGLSSAVVTPIKTPVGPNVDQQKSGPYKVPEYFCYHTMSYYEAEIEMNKFRLPQPSSLK